MTKLVIFDMDGTLFKTDTIEVAAMNAALIENGFKSKSEDEILSLIGPSAGDVCRELLGNVDAVIRDKFISDVTRYEIIEIARSGELYNGVFEMLSRLKDKGYTVCICTNGLQDYVNAILDKFRLRTLFDMVHFYTEGITKVDGVGIIKERFDVETFVLVGDRLQDIKAAAINGGVSIGVTYGYGKEEVHAADYVAENINEIEKIMDSYFESGYIPYKV
ncbi:MAG TPA: HAD family hydrolase [Clostridia bacterium]